MKKLTITMISLSMLLSFSALTGCKAKSQAEAVSVYAQESSWAYLENDTQGKDADVFFITPTVYLGDEENLAWAEYDEETMAAFVGAINMEKGIYDDNARFFAPYYHQAALSAYYAEGQEVDAVFEQAYAEIKEAFDYYLENYNEGRPIIIAGFSQGAQHSIRLLEEYSAQEDFNDLLVACYAVGWRFTEEEQETYPEVSFAEGEYDTGVLIAFCSEDPEIEDSLFIPEGTETLAINPLNWTTDGTEADEDMNLGACFTNYDGEIVTEIADFTGAYIDDERGALKVTDVDSASYPGVLFEDGIYHLYDYQFFYRNLEKNVQDRIETYVSEH